MEWNSALTFTFLQGILQDGNRFRHAFLHSSLDVEHGMVNLLADKVVYITEPTCTVKAKTSQTRSPTLESTLEPAFCHQSVVNECNCWNFPLLGALIQWSQTSSKPNNTTVDISFVCSKHHALFVWPAHLALIVRAAESWLHPGRAKKHTMIDFCFL